MKQKLRNPIIQQYVLEILLPIVGYFFFGWSMTIIAVFYLVDFLCAEIARNRRVYKVYRSNNSNSISLFVFSLIGGTTLFLLSVWWVWMMVSWYNLDYEAEMINELTVFAKEELWLLLPIVYLVYHVKDVMMFYMPRRFLLYNYNKMVKNQLIELVVLVLLIFAGTLVWQYFRLADVIVLLGFIVLKVGFDILVARTLDQKYQSRN